MPHVPEELKERLKREVSIQRLAEARGIKLTRKGKSLMGLCPFHDDHSRVCPLIRSRISGTAWGRAAEVAMSSSG